ncbi:zinc finger protein 708-like isoform X1 [Diorhabda sublineata]|uniref:zinc finger protein 708-like isoform X1 n=1 Tax=Diorhabda sublineata TaxID=1163346 RepID=UPI0024E04ECE|nr:zinc finger protein 708-like isoform X1 [Diorhabda sublineata]XP_056643000.1 zinc finger protein 708-like isoform X1 [Diorhabda sublineata]XP_056643001.1 zinc finger protein 708-like isoform X1 [Diorhabda sublineata]
MEYDDDIEKMIDIPSKVIDGDASDDVEQVDSSLESKYIYLYKENQLLKRLLNKIPVFSDSKCNGEYIISTESNHLIDLTDIQNICRVCLQKSDSLISLEEQIVFENRNIHQMSILEALKSIVCDTVDISDNLPHKICTQCQNYLKSFITFKYAFNRAASILNIFANGTFETSKPSVSTSSWHEHDYSKKDPSKHGECLFKQLETNDTNTDNTNVLTQKSEDFPNFVKIRSPTRRKILRHEVKKKMNILHTCPICWTKMSMSKLIPHVKSHKTLEKYLNIPKVSSKIRFYAPARHIQGLLSGEGEKLHECPICKYEFKATEFILHVHHHLTHDRFKCEKCHRSFKKKSYLLSHMLVHNKTFPFRCEKCNKGFVIKSNYECHLLTHEDGELPHKCIECGKGFSNPRHLSRHMTVHTENRTYSTKYRYKRCKYCGEGFSNKEQLVEHVCHQYGVYKCKYCFKVFLNSRTRLLHIHKVHFNGKNNPGYCPICNLTFKNINYHKASKHPRENLKALCTVCGLHVTNIYTHMLKHRNVSTNKSYQCPICSKLFSYRTTLKKHLTIHSGVKPYICSFCGKAFNSIYNLQVHERIHVGNRCHVCPICDKGFLEKSYLNKHMKTHKDVDVLLSQHRL